MTASAPGQRPLRVLALTPYPRQAACTRYRLLQLIAPLADRGVEMTVRSFLDERTFSTLYERSQWPRTVAGLVAACVRHLGSLRALATCDVVVVAREAALLGPPWLEQLATAVMGKPLILDLDDATYLEQPGSVYGPLARWLRGRAKPAALLRSSAAVVCGNDTLATYVTRRFGRRCVVLPTIVDVSRFVPAPVRDAGPPVVGWIGTRATAAYLETILPALAEVATQVPFRLCVVGSGRQLSAPGLEIDHRPWTLDGEVAAIQSFDVGLYPLPDDAWSAGKSGLKSVQYLACGVPFVVSPVGIAATLGEPGRTHLEATDEADWCAALRTLLTRPDLRLRLGRAGRRYAETHFVLGRWADAWTELLCELARGRSLAPPPALPTAS